MRIVIAQENDLLDAIVWRHLGRLDAVVKVLEANPHLAQLPVRLPAGTQIIIPDLPDPPAEPIVRLWS